MKFQRIFVMFLLALSFFTFSCSNQTEKTQEMLGLVIIVNSTEELSGLHYGDIFDFSEKIYTLEETSKSSFYLEQVVDSVAMVKFNEYEVIHLESVNAVVEVLKSKADGMAFLALSPREMRDLWKKMENTSLRPFPLLSVNLEIDYNFEFRSIAVAKNKKFITMCDFPDREETDKSIEIPVNGVTSLKVYRAISSIRKMTDLQIDGIRQLLNKWENNRSEWRISDANLLSRKIGALSTQKDMYVLLVFSFNSQENIDYKSSCVKSLARIIKKCENFSKEYAPKLKEIMEFS